MAVVPGDELGGRPRARQRLAGNAEPLVGLRAERVDDRVIEAHEVGVREVAADFDVPEEAEAGLLGDALEGARDALQLGMVRRDAEPHQAPGRRQPLEHVDLDLALGVEQRGRGVEAGRAGTDYRYAEFLVRQSSRSHSRQYWRLSRLPR